MLAIEGIDRNEGRLVFLRLFINVLVQIVNSLGRSIKHRPAFVCQDGNLYCTFLILWVVNFNWLVNNVSHMFPSVEYYFAYIYLLLKNQRNLDNLQGSVLSV